MLLRRLVELVLWLAGLAAGSLLPAPLLFAGSGDSLAVDSPQRWIAGLQGDYVLTSRFWREPAGEPDIARLPARRDALLGGRVLRLSVGSPEDGFEGTGLMGHDDALGRYWYVWTDTSTAGIAILHGRRREDGTWRFEGHRPTREGPAPLVVEVRREGADEVHEYTTNGVDGRPVRFLELRYRPR